MWPASQRPWKLFLIQKGQEGTRTKKGTHIEERDSKKEASVTSKWKGSGEHGRESGSAAGKEVGVGRRKHRGQPQLLQMPAWQGIGSGWSVTFLLLALGHEFKSHIGFKLRAAFAVALLLSVQQTKRTSKRSMEENRVSLCKTLMTTVFRIL